MPGEAVNVRWEIAADESMQRVVRRGMATARPDLAHSVHAEVDGLRPGRWYWYRFDAGGEASPIGRTRTAPAIEGADRLRFAFASCQHYESGLYTAYRHMSEEDLDLVAHLGDYIYEYNTAEATANPVPRRHLLAPATTLELYRSRYGRYKSDPDLQAAHQQFPWIVTWDDHEVANNYAGDIDENGTPPELFVLRRAAAYQAYYETMPLRASALPSGSHMRIHRRLQFGNLVDLSALDTRQWRSDQPCGDGSRTNCLEALAQSQTMMGAEQEQWLFDNLATVKARWTVIGQQVISFAIDRKKFNPEGQFSMDRWDGYVAARQRLYNRLLETKAPNPIVLSGDAHQHYGADLKMDFTNPRSRTVGVEFTNSAVTTTGDGSDVGGTWEVTKADNPHVRYHSNRRGYIACTATRAQMRADFKILDSVTVPDRPARIGGSLVVEAGRPGSNTD